MGNVLLNYDPDVCLDYFLEDEEDKALIKKELFDGPDWIDADLGFLTEDGLYECVKRRIPERLHPSLRNCVSHWHMCMTPVPGAREFCEKVKQQGYKIYVLSNASKKFYDYFPTFAPLTYFDGIVVSCDIHHIKPESEIYEYLMQRYSLMAEECFFIDDRPENVEAAKKAGMEAVVFDGIFPSKKL